MMLHDISTHLLSFFFFFNDTATTEIYTLSLHDALPIFRPVGEELFGTEYVLGAAACTHRCDHGQNREGQHGCDDDQAPRSEEHTSELQSQSNLVCRLLLEKKKNIYLPSMVYHTRLTSAR